jgi:hypothetical protein
MRATQTLQQSHRSTQVPDHVLHVALAKGGSSYPKFPQEWHGLAEQSTKPQTIGFSLADSPVGLLAWIYEKLVVCSEAYPWTDDEGGSTLILYLFQANCTSFAVLTWGSIYWFSRAGPPASVRIYYELTVSGDVLNFPKTTVPPFSQRSLSNYRKRTSQPFPLATVD